MSRHKNHNSNTVRDIIIEHLNSHDHIHLATVSPEGVPVSQAVRYVSEGNIIYILLNNKSVSFRNIIKNRKVAYSVEESRGNKALKDVEIKGSARLVTNKEEIRRIVSKFLQKFSALMKTPPGTNDLLIKIIPLEEYLLDESAPGEHMEKATV